MHSGLPFLESTGADGTEELPAFAGGACDPVVALALNNRGRIHDQAGRRQMAIRAYQSALVRARASKATWLYDSILYNLATSYRDAGNTAAARRVERYTGYPSVCVSSNGGKMSSIAMWAGRSRGSSSCRCCGGLRRKYLHVRLMFTSGGCEKRLKKIPRIPSI